MAGGRAHIPQRCGWITVTGAREHNLQNITVRIPRNKLVVVTGVSGSGKSTLAFDILFSEGQRRFLDSMNAYARQFVEQLPKPDIDSVVGLPPTVSIEQRVSRGGGKSTVATVTEIYHFLRLLYSRLGVIQCPDCGLSVAPQTRRQLGHRLRSEIRLRGSLLLLAPVIRNRKGFHTEVGQWAAKNGYSQVRADGKLRGTRQPLRLDRFREHDVEIVVGRIREGEFSNPLIDDCLRIGRGVIFAVDRRGRQTVHSTHNVCIKCGTSFEVLDPKDFSHNSPRGWCPECRGFGELFDMPDLERGGRQEAVEESWFEWRQDSREVCPECEGSRLNRLSRAVRLPLPARVVTAVERLTGFAKNPIIENLSRIPIARARQLFQTLEWRGREGKIARDILPEIRDRLQFLDEVGLGYLQLGRAVTTLSGGEAQRIRLAAQLGSTLGGVLYVLDEPTIGLHARDNQQLLDTLEKLCTRGNSVVVVEHDEDTMQRADYIVDLGPGAGVDGGRVVATGTLKQILKNKQSATARELVLQKGRRTSQKAYRPTRPAPVRGKTTRHTPSLVLRNACANNLKNLTFSIPLGRFVVVTGVSGSGKSTLVRECLLPGLRGAIAKKRVPSTFPVLEGAEWVRAVYEVDQSPIGRTPRSVPATYVGFFDDIRRLFAQLPKARMRGYTPGRFSFNSTQGRCPECKGAGIVKLEMNFLPPAFMSCEACGCRRYSTEVLDVELNGKNIAQVLEMSVAEATVFFGAFPSIRRPLEALKDTGLGYIKLGQTSPTLSGGEAQRVRLVAHLLSGLGPSHSFMGSDAKRNFFILEEPTIGLHMADVRQLVGVLQRLVDAGHTVLVIEHNPDLIVAADWVIDLGPEGGEGGGRIVARGTPAKIAQSRRSHTARFLRRYFPIQCKSNWDAKSLP